MAQIQGVSEEVKGQRFEVTDEGVTIGRIEGNTVVIDNPTVSSRHCIIKRVDKTFTVLDLDSTNGTRVNARDIKEQRLKPKDIIQAGSIEFVFDADDSEVDILMDESQALITDVTEEVGVTEAPESFESISPFGARKNTKGPWPLILTLVGLIALGAMGYLLFVLFTAQ